MPQLSTNPRRAARGGPGRARPTHNAARWLLSALLGWGALAPGGARAQDEASAPEATPTNPVPVQLPRGVAVGGGVALPIPWPQTLGTYIEDEVQRDYRLNPTPGYYPFLQRRTNSPDLHFHVTLVLEAFEVRYGLSVLPWSEAVVTHVSCTPVEVFGGEFDDATADYREVGSTRCTDDAQTTVEAEMRGDLERDISDLELPSLQLHTLTGGMRSYLWVSPDIHAWIPWGGGLVISLISTLDPEVNFGVVAYGGAGASYELSSLLAFEAELRYQLMVTTAPGDFQTNINHASATGDSIFSATFEVFHYATVHAGLRVNF